MAKQRKPTKRQKQIYRNIYQRAWYRKNRIEGLDVKEEGYKTRRTELYKELVEINRELIEYGKKIGVKGAKSKVIPKAKAPKADKVHKTITLNYNAWEGEDIVKQYLKEKRFRFITIDGNRYSIKRTAMSTILFAYDRARNEAYNQVMATTPRVNVTEDRTDMELYIDFEA